MAAAAADAIREFVRALPDASIVAEIRYVQDDISALRRAFPKDNDFSQALRSVSRHLRRLRPDTGAELDYDLSGCRRIKFRSGMTDHADLRIIFRSVGSTFELRAFGARHEPESIYRRAAAQ
jgi:hypothetical protein